MKEAEKIRENKEARGTKKKRDERARHYRH